MEQLLASARPLAVHPAKEGHPPSVMILHHEKGYNREANLHRCEILYVIRGKLSISYERFKDKEINKGMAFLFAPGLRCYIGVKEDTDFIMLRPEDTASLCEDICLEQLPVKEEHSYKLPLIVVNPSIETFFRDLRENLNSGLCLPEFYHLKVREFFYLLRAYYTADELAGFFYPLYSRNAEFALFVLKNYRYIKTVQEFARLYNCSVSYFDKHFRQAFGTSAYKWMLRKRVHFIYQEITTTQKSFKQIATDSGFGSQPQFTDFCKKHMGGSPGKLRQRDKSRIISKEEM